MPPPTFSGEHTTVSARKPLEPEHRADNVDNRIERTDFVQVDLFDGHLMDRGFGLGQALKEGFRPIAAGKRESGAIDQREDLRQAAVRMFVTRT